MAFWQRLGTAWNTLRDTEQAQLLLRGPLPLWMQEAFERRAAEAGLEVGEVIYSALAEAARALVLSQGRPEGEPG